MEIEYWRNRYQRMNTERFVAANAIALLTHAVTQPMDMVKTRCQVLQEGKGHVGIGFRRGMHGINVFNEIMAAGGGYRKFYSKLDAFAMRTVAYTTARIWGFLYFYDWINPDPRRQARSDFYAYAGIAGGLVAGVLSNPFELVFTRMQVDEMYPEQCRRNYKSFIDGLVKVAEEGALFRGAGANGLKLAGLVSAASGSYDWMKENSYYFFGPIVMNRILATTAGVATAVALSMPFDTIRTRLHTQRPLPNGEMPYRDAWDCFNKIIKYECSWAKYNNFGSFYTGGQAYFARLWVIAYLSQMILDRYHSSSMVSEFWQPARYQYQSGIDYDIHEPYTDGFNRMMTTSWMGKGGFPAITPEGKGQIKVL